MESVGSSQPGQPTMNPRLSRAMNQPILLLHRSGHIFHILGSTSNVYTVSLAPPTPICSCPDPALPCKHILFILHRVLRIPLSDSPSTLSRILRIPTNPSSLANPRLIQRFRRLFFAGSGICPVCLEEMGTEGGGRVVRCGVCGNGLHEECWGRWRRIRGRREANCVICRARWRERRGVGRRYLNLSAGADETVAAAADGGHERRRRRRVCDEGAPR